VYDLIKRQQYLVIGSYESNQLNEVVVTKGATAKINRRDACFFEMKAAEIQEIPVEGRDITRVLFRLPNVSAGLFFPSSQRKY
jgi:hypothetical protein